MSELRAEMTALSGEMEELKQADDDRERLESEPGVKSVRERTQLTVRRSGEKVADAPVVVK